VAALLDPASCLAAVEEAFRRHGAGEAAAPGILGVPAAEGGFHIKAGLYGTGNDACFVAKTNANFPGNGARHGLPTIQGLVQVFDAATGRVLAVMDSIEITILRTGAATAVAAKYLARPGTAVLTVAGCGIQGRAQVRALVQVRPLAQIWLWDLVPGAAERMAQELAAELGIPVGVVGALEDGVRRSDLVVTCTPSTEFLVDAEMVRPGTFVAGVGVDSAHKKELAPALLKGSVVVADILDQCVAIGDLHHAITAGLMVRADVDGELGEIVAGRKAGRRSEAEIIVFDSTGMALQDAAAAVLVLERARAAGRGQVVDFGRREHAA